MKLILLAIPFVASAAIADMVLQTDWSGGPGVAGPSGSWGSTFLSCIDADWESQAGDVSIARGIQHPLQETWKGAYGISAGDVDGDMDADLVVITDSEIEWWENTDGAGTAWAGHVIDPDYTGSFGLCADDLDNDGDTDVVASSPVQLVWWENLGGGDSWVMHVIQAGANGTACIIVKDMDSDGSRDVLVAAMASNLIAWWDNLDGQGTSWAQHIVDGDFYSARSVYADDVDGDGDKDVLGAALGADLITWWENLNGSGSSWSEHQIDDDFSTPWGVSSGDLDGDGDTDVAGASFNGSMIACYENLDGQGTSWSRQILSSGLWGPDCVLTADPDEDGDLDVIGTAYYESVIWWWENTVGPGGQWPVHELDSSFDGAIDVAPGDFNGDGHEDCAGAACYDTVEWWDTYSYASQASLLSSILYTGDDPDWTAFAWAGVIPAGTSMAFQVRSSDDPDAMGAWSDTLLEPAPLHGLLPDGDSYFQYRAILQTSDPGISPQLAEAVVSWDPLGAGGEDPPERFCLLPVVPDPSDGPISVEFGIPSEAQVLIEVFDLSGRLVESLDGAMGPGWHSVQVDGLGSGIYFVRVESGASSAVRRFAILR